MSELTNEVDNLIHEISRETSRQRGQTTALIKLCMEQDGLYVVPDEGYAKLLREQYPKIRVARVDQITRASVRPIFVDHFCWQHLASRMLRKLDVAESKYAALKNKLETVRDAVEDI